MSDIDARVDSLIKRSAPQKIPEDRIGGLLSRFKTEQAQQEAAIQKGPGLENFLARGSMSLMGDTAAEKYEVFKRFYPKGDLFRSKEGDLVFRESEQSPYRKVDPSIFSDEGRGRDLLYDVADFSAQLPVLAAELGIFGATRQPGALANTGRAILGGLVGEGARQGAQSLAGTQKETGGEITAHVLTEGMLGGVGELAMKPIVGAYNMLRGGANIALRPGADRAIRAERDHSLPTITAGQAAWSPLVARWEGMGKTMSSRFMERMKEQKDAAAKSIKNAVERPDIDTVTELTRLVRESETAILNRVKHPAADSDTAGASILLGAENWNDKARALVDAMYNKARAAASAAYDIAGLQETAREVLTGTQAALAKGGTVRVSELHPKVREIADLILKLDPRLPDVGAGDATDQLKQLRSQLWDLKTPAPGDVFRQEHRDAATLYKALTDTMRKPIAPDDVGGLWRAAAEEAERRFRVLDRAIVGQILKTRRQGGESIVAKMLLNGGRQSDVKYVKELIPGERFDALRGHLSAEIVRNPSLLDSMDQDVLKEILPKEDVAHLRGIVGDLAALRASDMAAAFAKGGGPHKELAGFLMEGTPAQTKVFVESVKRSPEALQDVRAAVIDAAYAAARRNGEFSIKAFDEVYHRISDSGLLKQLFEPSQVATINDLRKYLQLVSRGQQDAGTSLMAAQVTSPAQLARGTRGLGALVGEIIHQISIVSGLGRFLMSEAGSRMLRGAGRKPARWGAARALAAAAAGSFNDTAGSSNEQQDDR